MPTQHPGLVRVVCAMAGVAGIIALAGCTPAAVVQAGSDHATHISAGGRYACPSGASIELDGKSHTFLLTGDCGPVAVNGDGNTVHLQHAGSLHVQGQSNTIDIARQIGSVVIQGNGVRLEAASIGSIQVTGQRNSIDSPAIGSVVIQGDQNAVTTNSKPSDYRATGQGDTLTVR